MSYQEAARFEDFEHRAAAFEAAYIDFLVAAHGGGSAVQLREIAIAAATHASGMGLYRDAPDGRVSEAAHILAVLGARGEQAPGDVLATIAHDHQARRLRLL